MENYVYLLYFTDSESKSYVVSVNKSLEEIKQLLDSKLAGGAHPIEYDIQTWDISTGCLVE